MNLELIAHVRESDKARQTLCTHLIETSHAASIAAKKCGLALAGELIGILHDLGKHSSVFQAYIQSATGLLNPDEDEECVDAKDLKGKVDHSTAGAQFLWMELAKQGPLGQIVGQILALCIASHHSGLIDCLTSDTSSSGEDSFSRRMAKQGEKTHLEEAISKADIPVMEKVQSILSNKDLVNCLKNTIAKICKNSPNKDDKNIPAQFQIGLLVRFLYSCLIDADRLSTADFEKPFVSKQRLNGQYISWDDLAQRLEVYLGALEPRNPKIDDIRKSISLHCLEAATKEKGLFTLTVPTGGGKTLASLRFALHHAKKWKLDRVIYVIPFTSIIDQNADVARKALEPGNYPSDKGRIVLEHHSNLAPESHPWHEKILAENWDAPVVYTTNVQVLEALFGAGTRGARRMHQLANSVIVFDEIQTLPIRCVHLFNNAINFLVEQCGSSVVLCTATQPLLGNVDKNKGALRLSNECEIMPDVRHLFKDLQRVSVQDLRKPGGWIESEIANLTLAAKQDAGSCLVVTNTKKAAKALYRLLRGQDQGPIYHLSTNMCPTHRREVLGKIRNHLSHQEPMLCISTQLIEAGVDVDFGSVIRFLAGLDSIAQAAGRCNRNASRAMGSVYVINPAEENLDRLDDIRIGCDKARRVIDDFKKQPDEYDGDLIGPKTMAWYYQNYFYDRKDEMDYPVNSIGRNDTLLNLLSTNTMAVSEYNRNKKSNPTIYLRQSFMAAAKAFRAIDSPTQGVIVPYGKEGRKLVGELCGAYEIEKQYILLRQAQQYTVNVFPNIFQKLTKQKALLEVQQGTGIYYLDEQYYSKDFGLSTEFVSPGELFHV